MQRVGIGGITATTLGDRRTMSISQKVRGDGAARRCALGKGLYLQGRIVEWQEGRHLTVDVYKTNLPLESNFADFHIESDGERTLVAISPDTAESCRCDL